MILTKSSLVRRVARKHKLPIIKIGIKALPASVMFIDERDALKPRQTILFNKLLGIGPRKRRK